MNFIFLGRSPQAEFKTHGVFAGVDNFQGKADWYPRHHALFYIRAGLESEPISQGLKMLQAGPGGCHGILGKQRKQEREVR